MTDVPDKRCPNGHTIDAAWDLCPFCPPEVSTGKIAVVRPRGADVAAPRAVAEPAAPPPIPRTSPQSEPAPVSRTVAVPKADLGLAAAPPRYVVGWLIALNGVGRGESHPLRLGKNTIGRDPRSDIVVFDEQTSAHHADLVYRPEGHRFLLMDHNSTNGTYVNDREIEPRCDLAARDIVRVGSHRFLFVPLCDDSFSWDDPRWIG